jgi:hypothetical protein
MKVTLTQKPFPDDVLNEARRRIATAELVLGSLSAGQQVDLLLDNMPALPGPDEARALVVAIHLDYRACDLNARSLIVSCGQSAIRDYEQQQGLTDDGRKALYTLLRADSYLHDRAGFTQHEMDALAEVEELGR